ncbi:MAG TPA: hypothetical protein VK206_13910, partial [Anaerolineales bacterium]|nr:hypothetical protein [Anaerolineales bacterium]
MNESFRLNTILNRVTQSIVLAYQGLAIVIFLASLWFAYEWLRTPFLGGFFEQTMMLNGTDTREVGSHWALYAQGFKIGDQLVSVNGQPISSAEDLDYVLSPLQTGQNVPIEIRTTTGDLRQANVKLQSFPAFDRLSYLIIPAILSLVFLGISLWIFGLRRAESAGRAFSMMTTSLAIVIGALFDLYTTHRFTYLWTLAAALSGGALIDLALCFPQEPRFLFRYPYLRWFGYVVGAGLAINAYFKLYDFANPTAYFVAWRFIYIFTGLSALFYFGALAYHAFLSRSPVVKSQARTILFGVLFAFGPIVVWLLYSSWKNAIQGLENPVAFNPYLFVPFILFPLVNGYVILRFRLLRTDYW